MSKKLTEKQRRFADEYIRLGKISQAAINAGYSEKTAHVTGNENLNKPKIKSYIDERMEQLKKESIAEQDEILQYLTSVMRGEVQDEVVMAVGDGDFGSSIEREEKRSDTTARTKAAELLLKRYPTNKHDELKMEKTSAETEFTKERTKLLQGTKKDTSLLDALIEGRKQYEQNRD